MKDRVERLEQLARLFEAGALTQDEFVTEKAKVLGNDLDALLPSQTFCSTGQSHFATTEEYSGDIRFSDNSSGQTYPEAEDQAPKLWRNRALFACGMAALIFVFHWTKQQASDVPMLASSEGASVSNEEIVSSYGANKMSCRQAMDIAAIATCGVRMHEWQASNVLSPSSPQQLQANVEGYQKSLQDARSVSGCSGSVSDGEAAAQRAFGDVGYDLVVSDIESAKRKCVLYAREDMITACQFRDECQ